MARTTTMPARITLALAALTLLAGMIAVAPSARGQLTNDSLPLARAYGSGVHAFFSGAFDRSHADLTAAIEGGTADPRAWYFRGLAAMRMGRFDEAEADFREGAERETGTTGNWPVSRALERVQGPERLRLEQHRTRARVTALARDREMIRQRYVEVERAQPDVLRRRRPAPVSVEPNDVFATPAERVPAPSSAAPAAAADPEPMDEPAEPATPAEPVSPAASEDPFSDSAPAADAAEREEPAAEAPLRGELPAEAPLPDEPQAEAPAEADDFTP